MKKPLEKPELLLPSMPSARTLEEAVLGACLLDRNAFPQVAALLTEDSFFSGENKDVWDAMSALYSASLPIDLLTVTERLRNRPSYKGGASFLVDLTNRVTSSANIEYHALLLKEFEIRRACIEAGAELLTDAYKEDADALAILENLNRKTIALTSNVGRKKESSAPKLAQMVLDRVNRIRNAPSQLLGIPSGFANMDKLLEGLQESDLYIIAARPGMGKTAFALTLARNIAAEGIPVGFFSLEMSELQLVNRVLSVESGIPLAKVRNPRRMLTDEVEVFQAAVEEFATWPLWIDDTPGLNILEMKAKARRMVLEYGVKCIFVDYLQLMAGDPRVTKGGTRDQEIGTISRGLKVLAKELNIPVIALSQLSRSVETRGGMKRPQLSDLRESGNLEQDPDVVGFLYRPAYYNINEDEDGNPLPQGLTELIIAKHRNGALDTVLLRYLDSLTKFCNFEESWDGGSPSAVPASDANDLPF